MRDVVAEKMLEIVKRKTFRAEIPAANPAEFVEKLLAAAKEETGFKSDKWLYRIAFGALSVLVVIAAIGAIVLKGEVPELLVSLGSMAVGALVGLFAPSPAGN